MKNNSQLVIESLGGWHTLLQLCLTNPNAKQHLNPDQMANFIKLLKDKCNYNHDTQLQLYHACASEEFDMNSNNNNTNNNNKNNNTSNINIHNDSNFSSNFNYKHTKLEVLASNMKQYEKARIIINCDLKNNILFKLTSLISSNNCCINNINSNYNYETTAVVMYNFVSSKLFGCSMIGIGLMFIIIGNLIKSLNNNPYDNTGNSVTTIGFLFAMIYSICLISVANKTILNLVFHSFEFWYKMINYITIVTGVIIYGVNNSESSYWNSNSVLLGYEIIVWTTAFCVYICVFIIDAICMSLRIKRLVLIVVALYAMYIGISWYFGEKDIFINPFSSYSFGKYTQISVKSLIVSPQINLSIFVLKPIYTQMFRTCKKSVKKIKSVTLANKCYDGHGNQSKSSTQSDHGANDPNNYNVQKKNNGDGNDTERQIQRLSCVFKKPHVQWSSHEMHHNDQLFQLGMAAESMKS